jgi:molybdate transport system regulatory protein
MRRLSITKEEKSMKISARNILSGKVDSVTMGAVNAEVDLTLAGGEKIAAIITNRSAEALGLSAGKAAYAIIKASEVILGKNVAQARFSARNVLAGVVSKLQDGAVNSEVVVQLPGGSEIVSSITKASAHALELKAGDSVSAIIKASNVIIGID